MSSRMVSLVLTTRLVVALPAPAPPMRKKTSWSDIGSADVAGAWHAGRRPAAGPASSPVRRRRSARPACTPFTSATVHRHDAVVGNEGREAHAVARSCPGGVTLIVWSTWYTPGVKIRFRPLPGPALIVAARVRRRGHDRTGSAGSRCRASGRWPSWCPTEFVRSAGTNML